MLVARRLKELGLPVDWVYEMMFCAGAGGIAGREDLVRHREGRPRAACFSGTGLVFYGGAIGGALAVMAYAKYRGFLDYRLFDMGAPALAIGYAVGRLGCQLAGDGDYGIPSDLPWAMSYPDGTVPTTDRVHPTPIYEFLVMSAVTWWLWSRRDKARPGSLIGWWAVLAGTERLLVEFIRRNDDIVGPVQPRAVRLGDHDRGGDLVAAAPARARSELDDRAEPALLGAAQGEGGRGVVLESRRRRTCRASARPGRCARAACRSRARRAPRATSAPSRSPLPAGGGASADSRDSTTTSASRTVASSSSRPCVV